MRDVTGSRRFAVCPVEAIDANHNVDTQQVFAQAKYLVESGEEYFFTTEDEDNLAEINRHFSFESKAAIIMEELEQGGPNDWMTVDQIMQKSMSSFDRNVPEELRN